MKQNHKNYFVHRLGHNLLAIWVLKPLTSLEGGCGKETQPTRYMGIETFSKGIRSEPHKTQPTRYMGIETVSMDIGITSSVRHNLLAIWVLKPIREAVGKEYY